MFFRIAAFISGYRGHGLIGLVATLEYVEPMTPGRYRIETQLVFSEGDPYRFGIR